MNPVPWKALVLFLVATTCLVGGPLPGPFSSGVAWADDDDGGGDDDDGGGDDDDGGGPGWRGGSDDDDRPGRPAPQRRQAPSRPSVSTPPPEFRPEIVALDLAEADLDALLAQGFTLLETEEVPAFAATLRRLLPPPGLALAAARDAVRGLPSGADADFNHYYRGEQGAGAPPPTCEGPHCPAFAQVGWPMRASREACGPDVVIGLVDTSINAGHDTFAGARLAVHGVAAPDLGVSAELHGTSVTSLLVGAPDGRAPGLVPDLPVIAVDAFHREGSDERADVFTLIRALGLLADEEARVINLSFAGPANQALETVLRQLIGEEGVVVVAAAGNGGPRSTPAYPAAYEGVIAVTAVDGSGAVYRRAAQGEHIDLAAPGVEVWTAASIWGGRPKSGTSFAAPFVTAAAARLLQERPGLTPQEVEAALAERALDLGDEGHDQVFGHGLLQVSSECAEPASPPPGE
jgi:subtilisin family serine protease